jgi:hypothetical protein
MKQIKSVKILVIIAFIKEKRYFSIVLKNSEIAIG